jgi:hypothetical protein
VRELGQKRQSLREIDEERSLWLLKAPSQYYVYLRIEGSQVEVLDVIPRSRIREMGFESESGSSPSPHRAAE